MKNKISTTILSLFISLASLSIAILIYLEYKSIGFPDGYKTELDKAKEILFPIYIAFYCLFGLFLTIRTVVNKNKLNKLKWLIIVFISFTILAIILNYLLLLNLENGVGG